MKNITIILPIHTLDGDYKEMLKNATESIKDFHNDVTLSIVCPPSVASELLLDNYCKKTLPKDLDIFDYKKEVRNRRYINRVYTVGDFTLKIRNKSIESRQGLGCGLRIPSFQRPHTQHHWY